MQQEIKKQIVYRIAVKGQVEPAWADWLGGLEVEHDAAGNTWLTASLKDQAQLHGLLARIRDLNWTLLAVEQPKP